MQVHIENFEQQMYSQKDWNAYVENMERFI